MGQGVVVLEDNLDGLAGLDGEVAGVVLHLFTEGAEDDDADAEIAEGFADGQALFVGELGGEVVAELHGLGGLRGGALVGGSVFHELDDVFGERFDLILGPFVGGDAADGSDGGVADRARRAAD